MKKNLILGATVLAAATLLTSCGGGDKEQPVSVVLKGQVVDGPIDNATVCLYSDGKPVLEGGTPMCSTTTDSEGNYSLPVRGALPDGLLTLIATKGETIKLASSLGYANDVIQLASPDKTITPAQFSATRVTHFTTSEYLFGVKNFDDAAPEGEGTSHESDFSTIYHAATLIKAAIDFPSQSGNLLRGETSDTYLLAKAAVEGRTVGDTNMTAAQWLSAPEVANIIAATNEGLAKELEGRYSNYQLSTVVASHKIPPVVQTNYNGSMASIYCGINTQNESAIVQIALDASRRVAVVKFEADDEDEGGVMIGTYDPQSGKVTVTDRSPKAVSQSSSNVTYYSEGNFSLIGTYNAATGVITGNYSEMSATTWTVDSTRQECTASGTFTAVKS